MTGDNIFEKHSKDEISTELKRKQQILKTAAQVFARLGYSASIDQIAEEMGVTKGHIYYYFNSKQDILFQIFRQAMNYFLKETSAVSSRKLPADRRLKAIFKNHIIAICENRAIMTVFMDLRRDLMPDHWREIAASRKQYEQLIQGLIREGISKGYFITGNERVLSYTLLGAINWVYVWFQEQGDLDREEIAELMSDYLLRGLRRWPKAGAFKMGKTIGEITLEESASFSKTIKDSDICLFAGLTGDYNPLHLNEQFAQNSSHGKPVAHNGMILGLISPVIGMILPGIGSSVLETTCRHNAPVYPGDTITASATVVEIDKKQNLLKMKLSWVNQEGLEVASGEALVIPPREEDRHLYGQGV